MRISACVLTVLMCCSGWLPKSQPGRFLYIRPTLIGSGAHLGVQTPKEALLFIIALPWPDTSRQIMASAAGGLKLLTSQPDTVRAWPGGFGYAKLGANYGPSLAAHGVAQTHGFDQVLWLFGADRRQVTEAGASNIFVVWQKKKATTTQTQDGDKNDGSAPQLELVTPALDDQLILPGITRQSVLDLARQRLVHGVADLQPVDVVERSFTIDELEQAWREGRIIEAFVSGTAVSFFFPSLLSPLSPLSLFFNLSICSSSSRPSNPSDMARQTWTCSLQRIPTQHTPCRSRRGWKPSSMAKSSTNGHILLTTRSKHCERWRSFLLLAKEHLGSSASGQSRVLSVWRLIFIS